MERLEHFRDKVRYADNLAFHLEQLKIKSIREKLENKKYMDRAVDKIVDDALTYAKEEKMREKLKKDLLI